MANKNEKHDMNTSRVVQGTGRGFFLMIILQALKFPTVWVESFPIQSQTRLSPCLAPSSYLATSSFSTTCPHYRGSSKTTTPSSDYLPPLYSSIDDIPEFSTTNNETTDLLDFDSETLSKSGDVDRATQSDNTGVGSDGGLVPSYKRLLVFTATTVLIWLSEPLLSLVDTTIVGLTASAKSAVVQIAALGPATTLFDGLIYTTYFLAISTTNQLAPGLAAAASVSSAMAQKTHNNTAPETNHDNASNPWKELRRSTSHLLGLAIAFGSAVSAIIYAFGRPIIGQMVGGATNMGAAEANAIVPLATNYARIRAAVAPFSIVGFVAQSFCLTTLDISTPVIAVAAASVVNILGDLALSPRFGIQGAAIATAMATVTSCLILLRKVRKTTNQWKSKQFELESSAATTEGSTMITQNNRNALENESIDAEMKNEKNDNKPDVPFFSMPDKASTIDLFKLAGPIFFVMISKVACYNLMTVRATAFGIIPLASHNIMMRVFFFFACFGDSLSQAAQSFFPQVDRKARRSLIQRLLCIATFVGLSINVMSRLMLTRFGGFLTKDSTIIGLMAEYSTLVGSALLLHPFIQLLEGTVLAKRDLLFMVKSYLCTSLLHFGFVFSPVASTFAGLWRALFVFQNVRLTQFALRVWQRSRAVDKGDSFAGIANQDALSPPPI
mmetsp:Transcript_17356/g.40080  ORF Transcript_17356/g.40080 Transcript_17356/m.40080 type:complete len:669 (-) Transcript_17356:254-2260(-)